MLLDTETPFGSAYKTDHEFKEALLVASRLRVGRGEVANWASHLRFLTPVINADSAGNKNGDDVTGAKRLIQRILHM